MVLIAQVFIQLYDMLINPTWFEEIESVLTPQLSGF